MVWSAWDTAWADGLAVAKDYAAVHVHFLPPTNAVWGGDRMAIGVWAKNQRAAARKTHESARRRAAGESGVSSAGGAVGEPSGGSGRDRSGLVPGLGGRLAALFPPHPRAPAVRRSAARTGGRGDRAGRGSRSLDDGAARGLAQADGRRSSGCWRASWELIRRWRPVCRCGGHRPTGGRLILPRPVSSTPARVTCALGGSTWRTWPVTAARACLCAWGAGWTTRGVGPTSPSRNAGQHSMSWACAGRGRPGRQAVAP
ncbi:helicase-associated protein [Actinobacteria bacterium OK006]|nr:helicase-associated protein [Actinobacteria bacterium OK006]